MKPYGNVIAKKADPELMIRCDGEHSNGRQCIATAAWEVQEPFDDEPGAALSYLCERHYAEYHAHHGLSSEHIEYIFETDPVEEWNTQRTNRAEQLRLFRASGLWKFVITEHRLRRPWWPEIEPLLKIPKAPPKPTRANLWRAAKSAMWSARFERSRAGSHDTEYYSACGFDDACIEAAEWKLADAWRYMRAALKMM